MPKPLRRIPLNALLLANLLLLSTTAFASPPLIPPNRTPGLISPKTSSSSTQSHSSALQTPSPLQESRPLLASPDSAYFVKNSTSEADGNPPWKRPGQHCLWRIHFRYAPDAPETPDPSDFKYERVQQVTLTQHGKEYLQEVQMEGGKKWEYWSLNTAELYGDGGKESLALRPARSRHPNRHAPSLHREENANDSLAPESTRLPGGSAAHEDYHSLQALRWIRPEHYKTTLEIDGQQVLLFLLPPEVSPKPDPSGKNSYYRSPLGGLPMRPGITAAGIHASTRLPAFLQKDNEWRVYEFTPLRNERLFYPLRVTRFLESLAPAFKPGPKPLP